MANIGIFCGIDISKAHFDVCLAEGGKLSRPRRFNCTPRGMEEFLRDLPPGSHCVMESTGTYHCRLAYFLHERGIAVSVVNPLAAKYYMQSLLQRTHNDGTCSQALAQLGMERHPKLWKPVEAAYVEIRQLAARQAQLIQQEGQVRNQMEAIEYSVVRNSLVMAQHERQLQQLKEFIRETEEEMERILLSCEKENYLRLMEIPGIGKKTAAFLLAATAGMKGFETAKQLCSYFGLSPRENTSGSSVKWKSRISKTGMAAMRKLLYICAWSAAKWNNPCRQLYERLLLKGKPKKLALIAVDNKLLRQAFNVIKKNIAYDNNFSSHTLAR